jgi:hypothetical protein
MPQARAAAAGEPRVASHSRTTSALYVLRHLSGVRSRLLSTAKMGAKLAGS